MSIEESIQYLKVYAENFAESVRKKKGVTLDYKPSSLVPASDVAPDYAESYRSKSELKVCWRSLCNQQSALSARLSPRSRNRSTTTNRTAGGLLQYWRGRELKCRPLPHPAPSSARRCKNTFTKAETVSE